MWVNAAVNVASSKRRSYHYLPLHTASGDRGKRRVSCKSELSVRTTPVLINRHTTISLILVCTPPVVIRLRQEMNDDGINRVARMRHR